MRRFGARVTLSVGLLLAVQPTIARGGGAETAGGLDEGMAGAAADLATMRAQAAHYLRLKNRPAALDTLGSALRAPGGAEDFETRLMVARALYDDLALERAFAEARRAVELAATARQREQAGRLLEAMEGAFGAVTLTQAPKQRGKVERGYLYLEDRGGLIHEKKKEAFRRIRDRLAETAVALPLTIHLPFGSYAANLAPFETRRGEVAEAVTFLDTEVQRAPPLGWYVAGGVAVAGALALGAMLLLGGDEPPQRLVIDEIGADGLR